MTMALEGSVGDRSDRINGMEDSSSAPDAPMVLRHIDGPCSPRELQAPGIRCGSTTAPVRGCFGGSGSPSQPHGPEGALPGPSVIERIACGASVVLAVGPADSLVGSRLGPAQSGTRGLLGGGDAVQAVASLIGSSDPGGTVETPEALVVAGVSRSGLSRIVHRP